jgi:hypothetical protein
VFEDGYVEAELRGLIAQESTYGGHVRTHMGGYCDLANTFQVFYLNSLVMAAEQFLQNDTKAVPFYPMYLLGHLTSFRSIRAGEKLLYFGYPLDGLSLLRDIKDRSIFFAAQINGLTSWQALSASRLIPKPKSSRDEIWTWRRACEKEENRVLKLMLREKSGFEESVRQHLQTWEGFFNLEVHNSRLTMASEFGPWLMGKAHLSIGPEPNNRTIAAYVNRASEVFWMIHRTLPFLQLRENAFGPQWAARWEALDKSFDYNEADLSKTVPLAKSVALFVTTKLSFDPSTIYVERNEEKKDEMPVEKLLREIDPLADSRE